MTGSIDAATFCDLARNEEPICTDAPVVAVRDIEGHESWGCERHAGAALNALEGGRIGRVINWAAADRLLALPWNHRNPSP